MWEPGDDLFGDGFEAEPSDAEIAERLCVSVGVVLGWRTTLDERATFASADEAYRWMTSGEAAAVLGTGAPVLDTWRDRLGLRARTAEADGLSRYRLADIKELLRDHGV